MPTQNTYTLPSLPKRQENDYFEKILNTILGAKEAKEQAALQRQQLNMQQELTSAQAYNQRQQGGLFGQQSGQIADKRANKRIQQTQNRERLGMETPKSSLDLIKKAILGDGPSPAMPNPAASQQQDGYLQAIENALIPQRTQTQNALPGLSPPMSLHNTTAAQPEAQKQDYRTIADLSPLEFAGLQAAYAPEGGEGAYGLQALSYEPEATHDMLMRGRTGAGLENQATTVTTAPSQTILRDRQDAEAARTRQAELDRQRMVTDGNIRVANINAATQRYNTDQQVALQQQQMAMEAEQAQANASQMPAIQLSDGDISKLHQKSMFIESMKRLGNEVLELMKSGTGITDVTNRALIQSKISQMEIMYTKVNGLGALDNGVQTKLTETIPNPANITFGRDEGRLLMSFLGDLDAELGMTGDYLRAAGHQQYSPSAQGNPVRSTRSHAGKVPPDIAGGTDFASEAELREAEKLGRVKAGDRVIINGSVAILG